MLGMDGRLHFYPDISMKFLLDPVIVPSLAGNGCVTLIGFLRAKRISRFCLPLLLGRLLSTSPSAAQDSLHCSDLIIVCSACLLLVLSLRLHYESLALQSPQTTMRLLLERIRLSATLISVHS